MKYFFILILLLPLSVTSLSYGQPLEILLSEVCVSPTAGEFIEIYNPNPVAVDLSNVYLTDATFAGGGTYYYNIVTGTNAGGGSFDDFNARFPDSATIPAKSCQTVSLNGSIDFYTTYGVYPDYELYEDGGTPDGIPDMREAFPGSINYQGGFSNTGEVIILYYWDNASDLVTDLDYAMWGDKDEAVDKTGVIIDGPDVDSDASAYQDDTAISSQDVLGTTYHASGNSWQRRYRSEGKETNSGGNGVNGEDETSENLSETWSELAATPGAVDMINGFSVCPMINMLLSSQ